jgi:type IV secretion system protein VirB5
LLSVTYYLNPKQVSDQAKIYPQYEFINPLGLTVTEFHENRVSVDLIQPGTTTPNPNAIARPLQGVSR